MAFLVGMITMTGATIWTRIEATFPEVPSTGLSTETELILLKKVSDYGPDMINSSDFSDLSLETFHFGEKLYLENQFLREIKAIFN